MLELLAFAMIVGRQEVGPNVFMTDYLHNSTQIITVLEVKHDS
jgi:hypothetical protein